MTEQELTTYLHTLLGAGDTDVALEERGHTLQNVEYGGNPNTVVMWINNERFEISVKKG